MTLSSLSIFNNLTLHIMEISTLHAGATRQAGIGERLDSIYTEVPWGHIADRYFSQSATWLLDRLRGHTRQGEPRSFTADEIVRLRGALVDLSERIRHEADRLAEA